jgi:3-oxoacid CoA-transferase
VRNITAVSNNASLDGSGLSKLLIRGQITKMIVSYIGGNKTFERLYIEGKIDLELTPQDTIAELCRAGGVSHRSWNLGPRGQFATKICF